MTLSLLIVFTFSYGPSVRPFLGRYIDQKLNSLWHIFVSKAEIPFMQHKQIIKCFCHKNLQAFKKKDQSRQRENLTMADVA